MLDTLTRRKSSTDVFQHWLGSLPGAGDATREMAWRDEYTPEPTSVSTREMAWRDEYVPTTPAQTC